MKVKFNMYSEPWSSLRKLELENKSKKWWSDTGYSNTDRTNKIKWLCGVIAKAWKNIVVHSPEVS